MSPPRPGSLQAFALDVVIATGAADNATGPVENVMAQYDIDRTPRAYTKWWKTRTPLSMLDAQLCAVQHGDLKTLRMFLSGRHGPFVMDGRVMSFACQFDRPRILQVLIDAGMDPNKTDDRYLSPLMIAAFYGNGGVVTTLLNAGADVNLCIDNGTALWQSVFTGSTRVTRLLLDYGADPRLGRDIDNRTVFHVACGGGCVEIVEMLIAHGVDVSVADDKDVTALHVACYFNYPRIVEALLGAGAAVDVADYRGRTPLSLAREQGHPALVERLRLAGASD